MNGYAGFELLSRFIVFTCLTAPLPMLADNAAPQPPKALAPATTRLMLMKLPLIFEANQHQTASEVEFAAHGQGYSLFLTSSEAVLVLSKGSEDSESHLRRDE